MASNKSTIKKLLCELDEAYKLAKTKEMVKEMTNITLSKAKLLGIFDKKDDEVTYKTELIKFVE